MLGIPVGQEPELRYWPGTSIVTMLGSEVYVSSSSPPPKNTTGKQ